MDLAAPGESEEMLTMKCPTSDAEMIPESYEDVTIDRCPDCGGVWLDWGELGPIIESTQAMFTQEEREEALAKVRGCDISEGTRPCPVCDKQMARFEYAGTGVCLDRCPDRHGIWLDSGELEQVQIIMEKFDEEYHLPSSEEAPEL